MYEVCFETFSVGGKSFPLVTNLDEKEPEPEIEVIKEEEPEIKVKPSKEKNIATGETSPAITPYHIYHFSISTFLTFITSKLPSQDDFHHLITFTTR